MMRNTLFLLATCLLGAAPVAAQNKAVLQTKGWGSLTGKVVDAKTRKPVANAAIYLTAPSEARFPIHPDDKKRPAKIIIERQIGKFVPPIVAVFPRYFDGKKEVATGEALVVKNCVDEACAVQVVGRPDANPSYIVGPFSGNGEQSTLKVNPQRLPVCLYDLVYKSGAADIFVFDHPYFAITDKNGDYRIGRVPAGAQVHIMAWHRSVGWLLGKDGRKVSFKTGKNTFDVVVQE